MLQKGTTLSETEARVCCAFALLKRIARLRLRWLSAALGTLNRFHFS
jgi:hypothetical protein